MKQPFDISGKPTGVQSNLFSLACAGQPTSFELKPKAATVLTTPELVARNRRRAQHQLAALVDRSWDVE